ncbi:uncharacterized protein DSM5745_11501 [Aspergillus mulundensis]|uniref:Uncharacterized protein n=1 Tax=Aspergillus mulundensis TaxID=1810919 RepID=A0A3D8Q6V0_9EURO|nr:hypothetical protein DSM5745_11501 [Aspergillus mulundensis]RDW57417.1 hypothetical protein DSM5745_11501 [Aspergillus mulundensis]
MGSSLSLPNRDKRRRSNRLSKPPQNQSVPGCPSSRSLPQPAERALSLPSTPTARQTPWTGVSVPVDSDDFVLHNPRSQSFSAKPLSREATLRSSVARRSIHNTAHEDVLPRDVKLLPQCRPTTPSDFGYTHLGSLKLGSLRVVNGSASPCPSDRTRLDQSGSPALEVIPDILNFKDSFSIGTAPSSEAYAKYQSILDATNPDHVGNPQNETCPNALVHSVSSAINGMPVTILDISCATSAGDDIDVPASPFSFEKSPTTTSCRGMDLREADDEGISVYDRDRQLRKLSYTRRQRLQLRGLASEFQ